MKKRAKSFICNDVKFFISKQSDVKQNAETNL